MGLLLAAGSWVSFSAAHAQTTPVYPSWQFTPMLTLTDSSGGELAPSEGAYNIPYAQRSAALRVGLSVRIVQTGPDYADPDLAGRLGIRNLIAGLLFEPTGAADAANVEATVGSIASHIAVASANRVGGITGLGTPLISAVADRRADVWNITWAPAPGTEEEPIQGMVCTPSTQGTGATCDVDLGYLEFTPDIPPGGGITIKIAGYDGDEDVPEITQIARGEIEITASTRSLPVDMTLTQQHPALDLEGMDVTLHEGREGYEFKIGTTNDEQLLEDATVTVIFTGTADAADISILPMARQTMAASSSEVTFTISAVGDDVRESNETLTVNFQIDSGGAAGTAATSTFVVTIIDVHMAVAGTPSSEDIPTDGDKGFTVLPEGYVYVTNMIDDTVNIAQATSGDPVVLSVTGADGAPGDFVGATVGFPANMLDDGDDASTAGLRLDVTLDDDTDAVADAEAANAPPGFVQGEEGTNAFDVHMDQQGQLAGMVSHAVTICLPPDLSQEEDGQVFRFDADASTWEALAAAEAPGGSTNVCGTTTQFSAFAVFYPSTAQPDMNGDGQLADNDATIMYFTYLLSRALGTGG